jgi:hypothetical protein
VDEVGRVVEGQVAARGQGLGQLAHNRVGLLVVGDELHDPHQQQRDRPGEIEDAGRGTQDLFRVAQVSLDVRGDASRPAGEQGAGVGQHNRVVVDIDHP